MDVPASADLTASGIAAAIGEPARARMLYCLTDGRARTSTELAMIGEVSPSTASVHLDRLRTEGLVTVAIQGRHRYYSLGGPAVARVLEGLSVLAGSRKRVFVPSTPTGLRAARTCYDHIAGALGVAIHDRLVALRWIWREGKAESRSYGLTPDGRKPIERMGLDIEELLGARRRFAFACLDWSERRPHLGGALGAAILRAAVRQKWVVQDLNSRALEITAAGKKELDQRLGIRF